MSKKTFTKGNNNRPQKETIVISPFPIRPKVPFRKGPRFWQPTWDEFKTVTFSLFLQLVFKFFFYFVSIILPSDDCIVIWYKLRDRVKVLIMLIHRCRFSESFTSSTVSFLFLFLPQPLFLLTSWESLKIWLIRILVGMMSW